MRKMSVITLTASLIILTYTQLAVAQNNWTESRITNKTTETLYVVFSTWLAPSRDVPEQGYRTVGYYTIAPGKFHKFYGYKDNPIYFQIQNSAGQALKPRQNTPTVRSWLPKSEKRQGFVFKVVTPAFGTATLAQISFTTVAKTELSNKDGFIKYPKGSQISVTNTWVPVSQPAGGGIHIPDPILRRAITGTLNKPSNAPITQRDMEKLTGAFRASNKSITDITGLEFAVNLKTLVLSDNNISDIAPLRDLTHLIALGIDGNPISDIAPLQNLTNLKTLILSKNQISDSAPLQNLTNLETLRLIDDTGGFENLRGQELALWLEQGASIVSTGDRTSVPNSRVDTQDPNNLRIPDPNLRRVIAGMLNKPANTPITQREMEKLTGAFRASNTSITDLTGLEFAVNLKTLFLSGNNISDIAPLGALTHLIALGIDDNPISDISPLANLVNLKALVLSENQISDSAPLRNLEGLETLRLIDATGGFENLRGEQLSRWLEQGTSIVPRESQAFDINADYTPDEWDEFLSSVGMWCATSAPFSSRFSSIHTGQGISISLGAVGEKSAFWQQEDTVYQEASPGDGVVLTVRFMNGTPLQKAAVRKFAPRWAQHAELRFIFIEENLPSDIRVRFEKRGVRSASLVGNAANNYKGKPTLWLGAGYGRQNPEEPLDSNPEVPPSGTILHEFGHALGLLHEQSNPSAVLQDIFDTSLIRDMVTRRKMTDPKLKGQALTDAVNLELCQNYGAIGGVTEDMCKQYGVTSILERDGWTQTNYTEFDSESIMLYYDLPLKGGGLTETNYHLSTTDKEFIGSLYPKKGLIKKIEVVVDGIKSTGTVNVLTGAKHTIAVTVRDGNNQGLSNVPVTLAADGDAPITFDRNVLNTGPTGIGATTLFRSTGWNQKARLQVKAGGLTQNVSINVTQPLPKRLEVKLGSDTNPSSYTVNTRTSRELSVRVFGEGYSRPLSNVQVVLSSSGSASIRFGQTHPNTGATGDARTTVTFKGANVSGTLKVRAGGLTRNVSVYVKGTTVTSKKYLYADFTFSSRKADFWECHHVFGIDGGDPDWYFTPPKYHDFSAVCSRNRITGISHPYQGTNRVSHSITEDGRLRVRAYLREHCGDTPNTLEVRVTVTCKESNIVAAPALTDVLSTLWQELSEVPAETALLSNYPNPFNPETWIPYHLAEPADVTLTIYSADGKLVRTLALGYQSAGVYESKSRAAYWDGRNAFGERVASGLYLYTFTAGEFAATGRMLILK